MKKILFGICALCVCFVMSSCSSPADKLEKLAEDIEDNGDDWDADEWESAMKDFCDAVIDFSESSPKQDDYDEFNESVEDFLEAINGLDAKASRKMQKAGDNLDSVYELKLKSAFKKIKTYSKKYGDDEYDYIGAIIYLFDQAESSDY